MVIVTAVLRVLYVVQHASRNRILNGLVDGLAGSVEFTVAVLDAGGPMADDLERRGVPLVTLSALGFRRLPLAAVRLRRVLRDGWDLVQSNGYLPALATELGRMGLGVPSLLARHHNREHYVRGRAVHVRLDAWSARRAGQVLAVSDAVRSTLSAEGVEPERVTVVPNAVDWSALAIDQVEVDAWRTRLDGRPLLVAVGRLDLLKDYPTLLEATADVLRCHPDGVLAVAGTGPPGRREHLEGVARALGIDRSVRFLSWVPDVQNLLAAADCFVQSSVDESFGQSVVEAMGLGVPVAVTSPGGLEEVVRPWYDSLAAGDPAALAARMLKALNDPAASRTWAARAAEGVRGRYSTERMAAGHLATYRRLLGKRSP